MNSQTADLKWYNPIAMLFVTFLLVANVIASKPMQAAGIIIPASILVYPLTYILAVGITEVYGLKRARKIVWLAMISNICMALFFQAAIQLPPATSWVEHQDAYAFILGSSSRIVVASLVAYLVGELINTLTVSKLKVRFSGKFFWMRAIFAMSISEAIGSFLFSTIAFAGLMPFSDILSMVGWYYAFKMTYAVVAMPLLSALVAFLKKSEGMDVFDVSK